MHQPIPSPCIGICELDADDHCTGCHRTSVEIACWSAMASSERLRLMDQVLPEREARRS